METLTQNLDQQITSIKMEAIERRSQSIVAFRTIRTTLLDCEASSQLPSQLANLAKLEQHLLELIDDACTRQVSDLLHSSPLNL